MKKQELDKLILIGQQMSNFMFAIKQQSKLEFSQREQLLAATLEQDWDEAVITIRKKTKAKVKRGK